MFLQTISRTSKKSRPEKIEPQEDGEKRDGSESESEETPPRMATFEILEYGVDITDDQGWDTDLEIEGVWPLVMYRVGLAQSVACPPLAR